MNGIPYHDRSLYHKSISIEVRDPGGDLLMIFGYIWFLRILRLVTCLIRRKYYGSLIGTTLALTIWQLRFLRCVANRIPHYNRRALSNQKLRSHFYLSKIGPELVWSESRHPTVSPCKLGLAHANRRIFEIMSQLQFVGLFSLTFFECTAWGREINLRFYYDTCQTVTNK